MEKILPGKYVEIAYDLYECLPDGTENMVHSVDDTNPERFIFGITPGMIIPLSRALEGLEQGSEFNVPVASSEGFPYNPDDVATLDRDIFLDDKGNLDTEVIHEGARVPMLTADGYQISGVVLEVTADHVKMDFNHPLVGKDLRFKGHVVTVRDATPEEIHPSCGGGCGGCGGGCCGNCN